jgi:protein O-mannosyl-transferase
VLNMINIKFKKQNLIIYIILALTTFSIFGQVNQYPFVNIDDNIYVTKNSHISSGITIDGIRWAFSTTYAEFWHPLTWISLMADYQLYGLNPGGYHLTNLILHILSTLLLFWLFHRMTGAVWKSAFVAAFFALHPLHVESVAWISERKDVLSAFFWMLTLCLYIYYTEKPVIQRYLLVMFSFVCALMSKPMVVTLPVIMILLDYWPLNRFESKKGNVILWQVKEKLPLIILSAVFSILTIYAQSHIIIDKFPISERCANASVSFVTYMGKTFWPYDLAVFYPFLINLPFWQVLGATLMIIIISIAVIIMIKCLPFLFVGWLWYGVVFLPVIGIVKSASHSTHDCYTYLPSVGIYIMLAWGMPTLIKSDNVRKKILLPVSIVFLTVMSILTWQQCGYWENSIKLFSHALKATKDNAVAHAHLALALEDEGKVSEAIYNYTETIRIRPDYVFSYNSRGALYASIGQYQRAIEDYNEAIRLKPDDPSVYFNRGNSYINLGQYQAAIKDFNKVILLAPASFDAYNNRAFIYIKLEQYQQALEDYSNAILLKPDYADSYYNRGVIYFKLGNNKMGCFDARKACDFGQCQLWKGVKNNIYCR